MSENDGSMYAMYLARCAETDRKNGVPVPTPKEDKTRDDYDFGGFFGGATRVELMERIAKLREGLE